MEKVTMKILVNRFAMGCVAGLVVLPLLFFAGCAPQSDSRDASDHVGVEVNDGAGTAEDGGDDTVTTTNPDEGTGRVEEDGTTDTVSTNTGEPGGEQVPPGMQVVAYPAGDVVASIQLPENLNYVLPSGPEQAGSVMLIASKSKLPTAEQINAGTDLVGQDFYLWHEPGKTIEERIMELEKTHGVPEVITMGVRQGFLLRELPAKCDPVQALFCTDEAYATILLPLKQGFMEALFVEGEIEMVLRTLSTLKTRED